MQQKGAVPLTVYKDKVRHRPIDSGGGFGEKKSNQMWIMFRPRI